MFRALLTDTSVTSATLSWAQTKSPWWAQHRQPTSLLFQLYSEHGLENNNHLDSCGKHALWRTESPGDVRSHGQADIKMEAFSGVAKRHPSHSLLHSWLMYSDMTNVSATRSHCKRNKRKMFYEGSPVKRCHIYLSDVHRICYWLNSPFEDPIHPVTKWGLFSASFNLKNPIFYLLITPELWDNTWRWQILIYIGADASAIARDEFCFAPPFTRSFARRSQEAEFHPPHPSS